VRIPARRLRDARPRSSAALLVAAVGCVLVVALAGWSRLTEPGATPPHQADGSGVALLPGTARSSFALMQMNLCLSGLAGCYDPAAHPAVVDEVVARIRAAQPDAVTVNEACRGDAARIARGSGYHLRFSTVVYAGELLRCVDPGGRGLFGDAVLTRARVVASENLPFAAQGGLEERGWLCVTTGRDLDVCTAHLSTRRTSASAATNDAQCAELTALLARRAADRPVAFGGDVNRVGSCAPRGLWTRTDGSADQAPGVQHAYGSDDALRSPAAQVLPTRLSDHDVLLVRASLAAR
jgi:endonuclease/exonuclease/phosphatase family metal-dependent hydrolase